MTKPGLAIWHNRRWATAADLASAATERFKENGERKGHRLEEPAEGLKQVSDPHSDRDGSNNAHGGQGAE
jgi:hypothetical protein